VSCVKATVFLRDHGEGARAPPLVLRDIRIDFGIAFMLREDEMSCCGPILGE
jgi:hypothetical protein